ncbi:Terpene_synth domain-containing protein/Terpene_synth_C domain-containing protein [Cephalotus follicularis]|uniref:Terpene_synth domain-containing protein/Terpene_synth_C domain-containing protein n=1 Tax=Cephalotus follicularis TaxID=3775 RepID=A0A1Q3APW3_CEPFO|nr:Terpene_synth domain-containing protein/Terpene_synth_C domain-containing protein [Cephalotus follicularis]
MSFDIHQRCSATSKPSTQEYVDVLQNRLPVIKLHEIVEDDIEAQSIDVIPIVSTSNEISEFVAMIKAMLASMDDGEISISAYDTAWVALVEDVRGNGKPQFPSSLQWIAYNQNHDGSWGDSYIYTAHDRLLNTLACVIALKSWNIHPEKCQKGLEFFEQNISKLENENAEHMPIGFEIAFPSLLEIARSLNIEVSVDSPALQDIYAKRNLKLTRIPEDIMYNVPTTLLHSLEGMPGLDWKKLSKLQCPNGSFLFSPSSTAFALMQTKDKNCLRYLNRTVQKFNGGVPNVYPVDMFEHMWAVDRLQRLGISRYFQPEIKQCINYISRYWTEVGICWARDSPVQDIDDTSMGFRLLRLHGHDVSADVFRHFEKDGEFFCFNGQSNQAVTGMYNLFRASQVLFPGEKVLEDAKQFSFKFLRERQRANELVDKWIITKDLSGEVDLALDVPLYALLPRVESRLYIEQYGGQDDVWIGKTLYRMPYVSNNTYLQLAKLDFNNCQALHQAEWDSVLKWYEDCKLGGLGICRNSLLFTYFVAAASIFEPERSKERLAWAKTSLLIEAVSSFLNEEGISKEKRMAFVNEFRKKLSAPQLVNDRRLDTNSTDQERSETLLENLNQMLLDAVVTLGRHVSQHLRHLWENWLFIWEKGGNGEQKAAELLVQTIILTSSRSWDWDWVELMCHPQYKRLSDLTNSICYRLGHCSLCQKVENNGSCNTKTNSMTTSQIETDMQKLVQLVLQNSSDGIDSDVKQIFLTVAKSFYYTAYCDPETINFHIAKVLFQRVN